MFQEIKPNVYVIALMDGLVQNVKLNLILQLIHVYQMVFKYFILGKLQNDAGKNKCKCNPGWEGITCKSQICSDETICHGHGIIFDCSGKCVKTRDGMSCECKEGWDGSDCNKLSCGNVDCAINSIFYLDQVNVKL